MHSMMARLCGIIRREYLESLLHGIPFQQKTETAISGAHLDLTSNIPKGKQCSDILRQDDVQEVSFIGFESNWQSVLVFFSISPGFQALSGFQEYGHPTTHMVQNHLDWAIWGMGADASRCIAAFKCHCGRRRTCRFKTGQRCEITAFKLARIPHTKHLDTEPMSVQCQIIVS